MNPWISSQDPQNVERMARAASSFIGVIQRGVQPIHADKSPGLACAAKTITIGKSKLDISMWRLGDVWIAAALIEFFSELGESLREKLNAPIVWATLTNGWHDYWPTSRAMSEGGYEPSQVPVGFTSGDGEKLIEEMVKLSEAIK